MGCGVSIITTYRLRDESDATLWRTLADASAGKRRAYAWADADGTSLYDAARVRLPYAETTVGAPVIDPETGESVMPQVETGNRLCDVSLVDQEDAALAAMAFEVQTASG